MLLINFDGKQNEKTVILGAEESRFLTFVRNDNEISRLANALSK